MKQEHKDIPFRKPRKPRSTPRTPVERLRRIIDPETDLEELLGRSRSWMTKLGTGRIPMTLTIATQLELETGISSGWLLGTLDQPPVDVIRRPYTIETFGWWRSMIKSGQWPLTKAIKLSAFLPELVAIGASAGREGKSALFLVRLESFIKEASADFGADRMAGRRAASALANSPKFDGVVIHDDGFDWTRVAGFEEPTFTTAMRYGDSGLKFEMSHLERLCAG